ncbi:MAG: LamG domain-containing protein, partial [Candidatus Thorarchaeota archaeon]
RLYAGVNASDYWALGVKDRTWDEASNTIRAYKDHWYYLEIINKVNDNLVDSKVELYINGELADSVTKPIFTPSYVPTIGCYYYGPTPEYQYPWLGFIRDFTFEYDNITPTKEPKFGTSYIDDLESTYEINYGVLNNGILRVTLGGVTYGVSTNIQYIDKINTNGVKFYGYGLNYTDTFSYNEKSQLIGEVTLFNPDNNVAGITKDGLSGIIDKESRLGLEIPYEPNTADGQYVKLLVTASVDSFEYDLYEDGKYKLVVEVEDGVKWEWTLTNGSEIYADSIVNNKASTLVVSNAGTGGTLDKIRVYIETNSYAEDEVDVSIAVHSIETITKTGFNDSLDELVPQTITTNLSNEDQFAYYDAIEGCYTLEDRGKFNPTNDEPASITIPIPESSPMHKLETSSILSLDYLYTSDNTNGVGIMLNMDVADYGGNIDIWYDIGYSWTITADEYYYYTTSYNSATEWRHELIPFAEVVGRVSEYQKSLKAGDTLNSITFYLKDGNTVDRSKFSIRNIGVSNKTIGLVSLEGRKVGNREQGTFYAEEWLASPLYPRYDGTNETRLLPTNLVINGGFEERTPTEEFLATRVYGYTYTGGIMGKTISTVHSGNRALYLKDTGTSGDAYAMQEILASAVGQKVGFGFWYRIEDYTASEWFAWGVLDGNKFDYYEKTVTNPIQSEWVYSYEEISLSSLSTNNFYIYWKVPANNNYTVYIDDVRLEFIPNRYDMADTFRGFDPENVTEYTFMDGWYELSRQTTTNYAILTDTTSQGDPSGYMQYYYAEFLSDSFYNGQIILKNYSDSDKTTWYLWLNGEFRGVRYDSGSGTETFGSTDYIEFQPGVNKVLLGKITHGTSSPTQFYVNIKVPAGGAITMLTPKEKVARSPVVFNDINYDTEWVTREPTEGSPILDLDLTRPMEETSQVYIMRSADNSPYRNHAHRNVCFYDEDGVEYYTSDNTHKTWLTIDDNTGGIGSSPYDDSADFDQDGGFTFGARFKTDGSVSTYSAIVTIRNCNCDGSSTMLRLWLNSDGDLHWYFRNDNSTYSAGNVTGSNLDDSKWHQVMISKEAGTTGYTRVYIDGELRGIDDNPDGTYKYDIHNIDIGVDQYPHGSYRYPFKGNIKDVIILKREMTQSEITQYLTKGTLYGRSIDNPKNLTSSILVNLAYTGLRAYTVNVARLKFYVDTENKMFFTGDKTIWHPFGTVIMSQDVIPGILFGNRSTVADDYLHTRIEKFIESGGKLIWAPGYYPFAKEGFYGETPVTVNPLGRSYSYNGAWGHQAIFDIEESNDSQGRDGRDPETGDIVSARTDYPDGLFTIGREDSYPATLSDTDPPAYGGRNNGHWLNYDPYMTEDPSFSQLPHEGYNAHMVLSNPEYDILRNNGKWTVYNGDGKSGDMAHYNYNDSNMSVNSIIEPITSPSNIGLWTKPYLVDYYGALLYNPGAYWGNIEGDSRIHMERAIVGIGTVQGGTNAKGMISVIPMLDWEEKSNNYLTGLNMGGGEYHKGKFEDRGKASITNSPTTTEIARKLMAEIFAENMITMAVDNITINVCRDNDTIGTNFLDLPNTERISYDWNTPDDIGPLTISEEWPTGTTTKWSMSQSIMGGDPGRAMANYEASHNDLWYSWSKMVYEKDNSSIEELLIGSDGSKARDSIITTLSIDKDTDSKYSVFSVTLPKPNVRTEIEDKLITSVVSTKSLYEGNTRYYTVVENPSYYNNYNMGIGIEDGGGTNYITSMDIWDDLYISNVRWYTYSEKISEYGRETLQGRYGSSDREMIVRNNDLVRVDL